jgi:hypothetical protein
MLDVLSARLPELIGGVVFAVVATLCFLGARALKTWQATFNGLSFFLLSALIALAMNPRGSGQVIGYFGLLPWMSLVPLAALKFGRRREAQSQEDDPPFSRRRLSMVGLGYTYMFGLAALMSLSMDGSTSRAIRFGLLIDPGPAPLARGFVAIGYVALLIVLVAPYRRQGKSSAQMKIELEQYASKLRGQIDASKRR